jgi:hypothetical protein
MLDIKNATIRFMVSLYAWEPGQFSPLVETRKPGMPPNIGLQDDAPQAARA